MEKLFKKGNITQLIFNSITLSKFGNEFIKIIIIINNVWRSKKDLQNKHKIHWDINILIFGEWCIMKCI